MSDILLTIGIPTFNGDKFLKETISSTLSQIINTNTNQVEIIISDNASTDNTPKIAEDFAKRYPTIVKYFRNKTNLGFDKNVDLLFKRAKGKYVEILGDDDFLCDGALNNILSVINQIKSFSVIMLNVAFRDISSGKEYGEFPIDRDLIFDNGNDFFQFSMWRTSAVSSLIIRKEDWNALDITTYFGNQWIHISAIVDILSLNKYSYIVSEKSVIIRTGNTRWNIHGNQLKIGLNHLIVFSHMLNLGYEYKTYHYFLKNRYETNLADIINLAPLSFKERLKIVKLMIPLFRDHATFWLVHIPVLLVLGYPLQILKVLGKYVRQALKSLLKPKKIMEVKCNEIGYDNRTSI